MRVCWGRGWDLLGLVYGFKRPESWVGLDAVRRGQALLPSVWWCPTTALPFGRRV